MRTYLDCIPCFVNQALRAARLATEDEACIKQVLDEVGAMIKEIPLESPPPLTAQLIYGKIAEITGIKDPYAEIKRKSTQEVLELYPRLIESVQNSSDPILSAIKIAIVGNSIDYAPNQKVDLRSEVMNMLEGDFDLEDYDVFLSHLEKTNDILYIADNAGETVCDKILIEQFMKPVTFVVRGAPAINDATIEDAVQATMDQVATILSTGSNAPGAVLSACSHEFNQTFQAAGLVIAKGQGNYESLSGSSRSIFFLLKIKCDVLARHIGARKGQLILKGLNTHK